MKLKKLVAAALAAVMSLAVLTGCSGGGGGGNGGTGIITGTTTYSSTRTCKMAQEAAGKSLYMEYWVEGIGNMGDYQPNNFKPEEIVWKEGGLDGKFYTEKYERNEHVSTLLNGSNYSYQVFHDGPEDGSNMHAGYWAIVTMSALAGVGTEPGVNVYLDSGEMSPEEEILVGSVSSTPNMGAQGSTEKMNDSNVTAMLGKYGAYDTEIFTVVGSPDVSITYAYDSNGTLKLIIYKAPGVTQINHINKFELNSSAFDARKLELANYNAVDRTASYIAGLQIL